MFRVIHVPVIVVALALMAVAASAQDGPASGASPEFVGSAGKLFSATKTDATNTDADATTAAPRESRVEKGVGVVGAIDPPVRNVAILIHEGVELLDFAGPGEVFSIARAENGKRAFRVYTVASSQEPITSQQFVTVTPNFDFGNCPKPDIIVLPGGTTSIAMKDEAVMKWVGQSVPKTEVTVSVCTGAFLLCKAGLLDGKKATTHWKAIEGMKTEFPQVDVIEGQRFIDNGKIITSAGVSAGIDASLHLVERLLGEKSSTDAAKYMEYTSGSTAKSERQVSVPNGIYLINRWTENKKDLFPLMSGEDIVEHDPAELEPDATDPIIFVTLAQVNSVLFEQLKTVDAVKQDDGRINLKVTLNKESAKHLERLSQQHLGRQVAIVINGKAVTIHKIRGIISDGKLQISRCTDDGCRVILKQLVNE